MKLTEKSKHYFSKLKVEGRIKTEEITTIIDTGASMTFVDENVCTEVGLHHEGNRNLLIANGQRIDFCAWKGKVELHKYKNDNATVLALPNPKAEKREIEGMLGVDIMNNFQLTIDWKMREGYLEYNP